MFMAGVHPSVAGVESLVTATRKKSELFKASKSAFFVFSILAGVFVGFSMIAIMGEASLLSDFAGTRIVQGLTFASALSLVIFAGSELFTGNVFIVTAGVIQKQVSLPHALLILLLCYLGNLVGSMIIASILLWTGFLQGTMLDAVQNAVNIKTTASFGALFARGILCNLLVCLGVWCSNRMQSESGKLIMIFWCIFLFIVCGYEHCVANMTLFSMKIMSGGFDCFPGVLKNMAATSLGNIAGGFAPAVAYCFLSNRIKKNVHL